MFAMTHREVLFLAIFRDRLVSFVLLFSHIKAQKQVSLRYNAAS